MSSREDRPRESRRTPGGKAKTPVAKAKDRPSPSAKNVVAKCAPRRRLRAVDRWPDPAQILGSLADAVTAYDREWRYVYVNQKASETIGLPARELLGRSVWEVYPGAEETRSYREFHRAMAEQVSITYEEFAPGFERWFEHRLHPSPHGLVVCSRDVGERHAAESERERLLRALTESEERFRALIENGLDGVMLTDVDGTALYMSPPGVRIGGWEPREIQGRKIFDYV